MLKEGLIIYEDNDAIRNKWFIDNLIKEAAKKELNISLIRTSELLKNDQILTDVSFILNHARNPLIAVKLMNLNSVKIINDTTTNFVANNKYYTYLLFLNLGLNPLLTSFDFKDINEFPCVMKTIDGHGGDEVKIVHSEEEIKEFLERFSDKSVIYQKLANSTGEDLRVYIYKNKIFNMVLRTNTNDFRANKNQGGSVRLIKDYPESVVSMVNVILKRLKADFIGIDFIKDGDNYIPNEIEDPVGFRSLYELTGNDMIKETIELIVQK